MIKLCREAIKRNVIFVLITLLVIACGKHADSEIESMQKAKEYESKNNYRASIIELKNVLQNNPKNAEARQLLGEIYVTLGDGISAEKEIKKAQEIGVKGDYIQQLLGESYILQHRYDAALSLVDHFKGGLSAKILVLKGNALVGLHRSEDANEAYRSALQKDPGNTKALLGQAKIAIQDNKIKVASDILSKLTQDKGKDPEVYIVEGRLDKLKGDKTAAIAAYKKAIALVPTNIATRAGFDAHSEIAKLYIEEKKLSDAESHVKFLLKVSPNHPLANYMAALLAFNKKNYSDARDYLEKVSKARPDSLQTLFLLGACNYALGSYEQALQQLGRVVTGNPSFLPARLLLAQLRLKQSQSDQALDLLEPAIKNKSDDATLLSMAAEAALQSGDLEKSSSLLQKAAAASPGNINVKRQLALLYIKEGSQDKAIKELQELVNQGKSTDREDALLAVTYLQKNDFNNAIEAVKKIIASQPKNANAYNLLGAIYTVSDKFDQAREAFQKSLSIDPGNSNVIINMARVDILSGDIASGKKKLEDLLAKQQKNAAAMVSLAQIAELEGRKQEGLEWLEKARSSDQKALSPRIVLANYYLKTNQLTKANDIAKECNNIDPGNPRVLDLVGKVQLANKDYTGAISTYRKLIKTSNNQTYFYQLAVAQFLKGDVNAAKESVSKVVNGGIKNLQASTLLVSLYVKTKDYKKALSLVEKIKRDFPKSSAGFVLEGDIHNLQKQPKKAAVAYRKAIEHGADNLILLKEAEAQKRAMGFDAYLSVLKEWLKSHNKDVKVRYVLAASLNTVPSHQQDAIAEYRKVIDIDPNYVPALNDLAWILYSQNKSDSEALAFSEKAYKLAPNNGPVIDTLGWIKLENGKTQEGLRLLRDAAAKSPKSNEIHYHLAVALVKAGNKVEAKSILGKLKTSGQNFPSKKAAEKLLSTL